MERLVLPPQEPEPLLLSSRWTPAQHAALQQLHGECAPGHPPQRLRRQRDVQDVQPEVLTLIRQLHAEGGS